ncbi:MAG TPA: four-carbon acid sugar kinase family protein, partial [Verrucomicrobiae bacterium]|nr:four-carbon acid sugar kinase family protein [Verrucomicrobiae bacterium]
MSRLLLTFYGDDFTGSTDALEQLMLAGIRTVLFIEPPTPAQLRTFPGLQAVGVAGMTRSMTSAAVEKELRPALRKLKALGAPHVHYKVCSTFDSSPTVGSIGRVMEVAAKIFPAPFIPILAAAPALGRYTIFGTHFARYGIGSAGEIHRLDLHPSISKHPVTPMTEADLRLHLSKQTRKKIALFDILKLALPKNEARTALKKILTEKPDAVLFDALNTGHLKQIGGLIYAYASRRKPLFSIGSSGVEAALAAHFNLRRSGQAEAQAKKGNSQSLPTSAATNVLIGSGSCSPVTAGQIAWALKHGFSEVTLNAAKLAVSKSAMPEIKRAVDAAAQMLQAGRSVIVHTARRGADKHIAAKLKNNTAQVLGAALGMVLRGVLERRRVRRICVAGGDTSSFAARALGIEALEMMAPLTPGAPLCRAHAPGSPVDGCEMIFKGGQVGAENYFGIVKRGRL